MTVYSGRKVDSGVGHQKVMINGVRELSPKPSQDVYNHSPDGFNWGYGGSGPAQLALAILLDVTRDPEIAQKYHQEFKWEFVATWGESWSIDDVQVSNWLRHRNDLVSV